MYVNINEIGSFSQLFTGVIFEALAVKKMTTPDLHKALRDYYIQKFKLTEPTLHRADFMADQSYKKFTSDNLDHRTLADILSALNLSLGFMITHHQAEEPKPEAPKSPDGGYPAVWDQKIFDLGLLPRTYNILATESTCTEPPGGLDYVGQLVRWSKNALRKLPGMGVKGVEDIEARLADMGQYLGADTGKWQPPFPKVDDEPKLSKEISTIPELSNYIVGTLRNNGVHYIGQLVKMNFTELWRLNGIGLVSIEYIKQALDRRQLALGMDVGNWTPPKK